MNSAWFSSPRQVDLLSWFTGPLVPMVLGGVAVTFGAGVTLALVDDSIRLVLAGLSIAAILSAFGAVAYYASPRRRSRDAVIAVLPISLGWMSLMLAVASEWGSTTPFELRWSPIALALLIASLAPYLPAIRILILGVLSCLVTVRTCGGKSDSGAAPLILANRRSTADRQHNDYGCDSGRHSLFVPGGSANHNVGDFGCWRRSRQRAWSPRRIVKRPRCSPRVCVSNWSNVRTEAGLSH